MTVWLVQEFRAYTGQHWHHLFWEDEVCLSSSLQLASVEIVRWGLSTAGELPSYPQVEMEVQAPHVASYDTMEEGPCYCPMETEVPAPSPLQNHLGRGAELIVKPGKVGSKAPTQSC